jgi:hypothetical protein
MLAAGRRSVGLSVEDTSSEFPMPDGGSVLNEDLGAGVIVSRWEARVLAYPCLIVLAAG